MKNFIILAAAVCAVLGTAWMANRALMMSEGTVMSFDGYAAMFTGVVLTLGVGCVLMVLVFYSSRRGYDEPAIEDRDETLNENNKH